MTLTEAKRCIKEHGREALEEAIKEHGEDVVNAALACDVQLEDISEAYQGQFRNDTDFAQEMAEQLGDVKKDVQWPYTCIDWEHAAKELMYDYCEDSGHYFRNL